MANYPEEERYGDPFKYGSDVGGVGHGIYSETLTLDRHRPQSQVISRILRLAWSHGCPIPREVIETRGPEYAMRRYSECNRAFRYTVTAAQTYKPHPAYSMSYLLTKSQDRFIDEGVGKHEEASVPSSHFRKIAPMATLHGFALPRLFVMRASAEPEQVVQERANLARALEILQGSLAASERPTDLTIAMANFLWEERDLSREEMLGYLLPQCILEEENCRGSFHFLARDLEEKAPQIAKFYQDLPASQRAELGIAETPTLK